MGLAKTTQSAVAMTLATEFASTNPALTATYPRALLVALRAGHTATGLTA